METDFLLSIHRTPGDEAAPLSFTMHGGGGGSRIDHVLVSPSVMGYVQICTVNASRRESDHFPIECTIQLPVAHQAVQRCSGTPLPRRH